MKPKSDSRTPPTDENEGKHTPCDSCDWTFGCFVAAEPCRKKPLPPASETATQTPKRLTNLQLWEEHGEQLVANSQRMLEHFVDLRAAYSNEIKRVNAATRELEEARARVKQLEDAKPEQWLPKSVTVSDIAAEAIQLRSDLLLARQQGEEKRGALEMAGNYARENLISCNIIDGQNNRGGHFWDIERDTKFIRQRAEKLLARLATPSPQGNNGETQ